MNDRVAYHLPPSAGECRSIGEHLVELGDLRVEDVPRVLDAQRRHGLLFGQSAIRIGLIKAEHVNRALARQYLFPSPPPEHELSPELIVAQHPPPAAAECIRNLRVQINARRKGTKPNNAIAIVSTEPREGRSFIAANLALAYAQCNVRTLLIDMDLRHPRQHELFGLPNRQGFSSALIGRSDVESIQYMPGYDALAVMMSARCRPIHWNCWSPRCWQACSRHCDSSTRS